MGGERTGNRADLLQDCKLIQENLMVWLHTIVSLLKMYTARTRLVSEVCKSSSICPKPYRTTLNKLA